MRVIAALLALGLSGPVNAQSQIWHENGKPAAPQPDRAEKGDFAVLQIATTDSAGFLKDWSQPTPGANLSSSTRAKRNQPITTYIILTGCRAGADGNCDVTVDFEIIDPKGGHYGDQKAARVWRLPPPPKQTLILSEVGLGLTIEPGELLGDYIVRAVTTDHNADLTLRTEQVLNVSEATAK